MLTYLQWTNPIRPGWSYRNLTYPRSRVNEYMPESETDRARALPFSVAAARPDGSGAALLVAGVVVRVGQRLKLALEVQPLQERLYLRGQGRCRPGARRCGVFPVVALLEPLQ